MKTIRIEDDVHGKLTGLVGELIAESGKMQTYADAITKILKTSIVLPENLLKEIAQAMKEDKVVGYTTLAEFVRDAVRRRLEEVKGEEFYVDIPIPREEYDLLNKAIAETGALYKSADDYVRDHIRRKLEEYEQYAAKE